MSLVNIDPSLFSNLKGKVVVLTGGATGIGVDAVSQLHAAGAITIIGDVNEAAQTVASSYSSNVVFKRTDVTKYADILALFQYAFDTYKRVDVAISNAGLVEIGQFYNTGLDDAEIQKEPTLLVLDVNLKGTLLFSRVAVHYLRKSKAANKDQDDAALILVSSVAGFGEFPGLFVYSASKHGVMGLLRATKNFLLPTEGIRVNVVNPDMTRTQMVSGVIAAYEANGVPCNDPIDVARAIVYLASQPVNGEALYVSGGKVYEIEKKLDEMKPQWLGQEVFDNNKAGQQALADGANWTKDRKEKLTN